MNMPFFRQHLQMCPDTLINEDIAVFLAEKRSEADPQKTPLTPAEEATPKPPTDSEVDSDIPLRGFTRNN
jgi:hypothetical protein